MATADVCTPTKTAHRRDWLRQRQQPLTPSPTNLHQRPSPTAESIFAQPRIRSFHTGTGISPKSNIAVGKNSPRVNKTFTSPTLLHGSSKETFDAIRPRSVKEKFTLEFESVDKAWKAACGEKPIRSTQELLGSSRPHSSGNLNAANANIENSRATTSKQGRSRVRGCSPDRFIPNRKRGLAAVEGGFKMASSPKSKDGRPKSAGPGSAILREHAAPLAFWDNQMAEQDLVSQMNDLSVGNDKNNAASEDEKAWKDTLAKALELEIDNRVLSYTPGAPISKKAPAVRQQFNRPLVSQSSVDKSFTRKVPRQPDRVLDAPELVDDYYLNLLDWSAGNQLAIALNDTVYVWSANTGTVASLCTIDTTTVSSIKWSSDGGYLSVGLHTGDVQVWDVDASKRIRTLRPSTDPTLDRARIASQAWNKHLLSLGDHNGFITNHDVRIQQHQTAILDGHHGEVCGLEWRSDGSQLASGANDNTVCIWDARNVSEPKFTKHNHTAAVKAVAWCPWQSNLLATGGGSADRAVHFWNTSNGARVNTIQTDSQVTGIKWAPHYRELVVSSGFPGNCLTLYSYPKLTKNVVIADCHDSRILHSTLSPDGQVLATAAPDENLKFWRIFEKDVKQERKRMAEEREARHAPLRIGSIR